MAPLLFVPGAPRVVRSKSTSLYAKKESAEAEKESAEVEKLKADSFPLGFRTIPLLSRPFQAFRGWKWSEIKPFRAESKRISSFRRPSWNSLKPNSLMRMASFRRPSWNLLKPEQLPLEPRRHWLPRRRTKQASWKVKGTKTTMETHLKCLGNHNRVHTSR